MRSPLRNKRLNLTVPDESVSNFAVHDLSLPKKGVDGLCCLATEAVPSSKPLERSPQVMRVSVMRQATALESIPTCDDLVAEFSDAAADPERWIESARELYAAANPLEPLVRNQSQNHLANILDDTNYSLGEDLRPGYLMLIGFAAENLLKAAIVKSDPETIRDRAEKRGGIPKELRTHDLYKLAISAGLKPSELMEMRLRRFARIASWSGRYPLPSKAEDFRGDARFSSGQMRIVAYLTSEDVADARSVLRWIEEQTGCSCQPPAA